MLRYNISKTKSSYPRGHIGYGASVANLESMWAARSMKFYLVPVACVMEPVTPLDFIRDDFSIELGTASI